MKFPKQWHTTPSTNSGHINKKIPEQGVTDAGPPRAGYGLWHRSVVIKWRRGVVLLGGTGCTGYHYVFLSV